MERDVDFFDLCRYRVLRMEAENTADEQQVENDIYGTLLEALPI